MSVMGKEFIPFSSKENISSDILEEYHYQALCKAKEIYGEMKDISCDSLTLDVIIGEEYTSFVLGIYENNVAMKSATGEVITVCDIIE
nr:MAG TPA_asm: hypothetical protein [Caudoviricetes sp.]